MISRLKQMVAHHADGDLRGAYAVAYLACLVALTRLGHANAEVEAELYRLAHCPFD